jgi:hypothetical protein
MRACGPFLLRECDILAAAQAVIHAVYFAFVERTIQANGSDQRTASPIHHRDGYR